MVCPAITSRHHLTANPYHPASVCVLQIHKVAIKMKFTNKMFNYILINIMGIFFFQTGFLKEQKICMYSRNTAIHYIQVLCLGRVSDGIHWHCMLWWHGLCRVFTLYTAQNRQGIEPGFSARAASTLTFGTILQLLKVSETLLFKNLGWVKDGGTCLQNRGGRGRRMAS